MEKYAIIDIHFKLLACSSMVEHSAVNRRVAGSSPAVPAIFFAKKFKDRGARTSACGSGASPAVPAIFFAKKFKDRGARTSACGSGASPAVHLTLPDHGSFMGEDIITNFL